MALRGQTENENYAHRVRNHSAEENPLRIGDARALKVAVNSTSLELLESLSRLFSIVKSASLGDEVRVFICLNLGSRLFDEFC